MCSRELFAAVRSGEVTRVTQCLKRITFLYGEHLDVDTCRGARHMPALFVAIECGFIGVVELLIAAKANINQEYVYWTPLMFAAHRGHTNIVELLLSTGVDVNTKTAERGTALTLAADAGHVQVVNVLIKGGASINDVGPYRNCLSALALAASKGHSEVVAILVEAGASIEIKTRKQRFSALTFAAIGGHAAIVEQLLNRGSLNVCSRWSLAVALVHALCGGFVEIVDMLLAVETEAPDMINERRLNRVERRVRTLLASEGRSFSIDAYVDPSLKPALITAVENGFVDVTKMLLDLGADIMRRHDGSTPMFVASQRGHLTMIELLISRGADVGGSALLTAAENGHSDIVELLLAAGTNVNLTGFRGTSALSLAAINGHGDVVKKLLDCGARVNSPRSVDRNSPLVHASSRGHSKVVDLLLAAGADVSEATHLRRTALVGAAENGETAIVKKLLAAGADITTDRALVAAAERGHEATVDILLMAGVRAQASQRRRGSALYQAAANGQASIVRRLIRAGAKVGYCGGNGDPALVVACKNGHIEVVKVLIDAGALSNNSGSPREVLTLPVMRAAQRDHVEVLELLASHGIDITSAGGKSSLRIASSCGSLACVRFLLAHGCESADVNGALRDAVWSGNVEVVEDLLRDGADLINVTRNTSNILGEATCYREQTRVDEIMCSNAGHRDLVGVVPISVRVSSSR